MDGVIGDDFVNYEALYNLLQVWYECGRSKMNKQKNEEEIEMSNECVKRWKNKQTNERVNNSFFCLTQKCNFAFHIQYNSFAETKEIKFDRK